MTTQYPNNPFTAIPGFDPAAMQNLGQAYKAWVRCMMTINAESTRFLTQRLHHDAQLQLNLLRC